MAAQNFVARSLPTISAAWLNQVDAALIAQSGDGRTTQEIASGVFPTNLGYPPGDVRRYGATGNGVSNDQPAIANAILALPRAGSANAQGLLYFPPGSYKMNAGISLPATVDVYGYGAILDFSSLGAGVAISWIFTSQGLYTDFPIGGLNGLTLKGPGTASTVIALQANAVSGDISHKKVRDVTIDAFGVGYQHASNTFNIQFYSCLIQRCNLNAYFPSGLSNDAEIVEFHGCVLSEAGISAIRSAGNSLDIVLYGGSIDYNVGPALDLSGDTIVSAYGAHFEQDVNKIVVKNVPVSGSPTFNAYGCTFTGTGGLIEPIIDGTQVHCVIRGGWIRIGSGTQTTFAKSQAAYDLFLGPITIIGLLTNLALITGGTGFKQVVSGGVTGSLLSTQPIRQANNIAIQGVEAGGTVRDMIKIAANDTLTLSNTNTSLVLDLRQIVAGFYGFTLPSGLGTNFGIYFRVAAGAPANGQNGIEQGSMLLNQADKKAYINTGTSGSTTWTVVGTQV